MSLTACTFNIWLNASLHQQMLWPEEADIKEKKHHTVFKVLKQKKHNWNAYMGKGKQKRGSEKFHQSEILPPVIAASPGRGRKKPQTDHYFLHLLPGYCSGWEEIKESLQGKHKPFPFSVITLLILFVVFSSFQTLLSPWLGTGYNSLFQAPSSYLVDSTTWCKITCIGEQHIFLIPQ